MTNNKISTHSFARALLARPDEYIRGWVFGKFSVFWDTDEPVKTVTLAELLGGREPAKRLEEPDE